MKYSNNTKALYIIVNAGYADDVMEIARESGILGATILNARGENATHEMFMGITLDAEKEMILCIADEATAKRTMASIKEKAGIHSPIHGVCFVTPVERVVGIHVAAPENHE